MRYLLDTNVLSEIRKPDGAASVRKLIGETDDQDLFLSVVTIGEVAHGIARLADGKRRRELHDWLIQTSTQFADRVLSIDSRIAMEWGELAARRLAMGRPIGVSDGLIAATAVVHGLTLLTRNVADFEHTGAHVVDPWQQLI